MPDADESFVKLSPTSTSYVGPDAVELFRATSLRAALRMFKAGLRMRGLTPTQALKMASRYTGKTYRRGQYEQAYDDMTQWIEAMKAAIPVIDSKEPTDG